MQTDRGRTRDSVEVHEVGVVVDLPGLPLLGHLLHVRGRLLLQATQPRLHAIWTYAMDICYGYMLWIYAMICAMDMCYGYIRRRVVDR